LKSYWRATPGEGKKQLRCEASEKATGEAQSEALVKRSASHTACGIAVYRYKRPTVFSRFYPLQRASLCFWYPKTPPSLRQGGKLAFCARWLQKEKSQNRLDNERLMGMESGLKKTVGTVSGKPKHKGGRPRLSIRREAHIKVRLTATEHFMIVGRAKEAGMKISDWFRAAAKAARVLARLKPEDLQIMRMLTGMANNLNQLTKLAHKDGLLSVARKCDGLMTEIDQALKYFNSDDR